MDSRTTFDIDKGAWNGIDSSYNLSSLCVFAWNTVIVDLSKFETKKRNHGNEFIMGKSNIAFHDMEQRKI